MTMDQAQLDHLERPEGYRRACWEPHRFRGSYLMLGSEILRHEASMLVVRVQGKGH